MLQMQDGAPPRSSELSAGNDHCRDAGGEFRVIGVTNSDAGNVGEKIFHEADSSSVTTHPHDQPAVYQPQRMLQSRCVRALLPPPEVNAVC